MSQVRGYSGRALIFLHIKTLSDIPTIMNRRVVYHQAQWFARSLNIIYLSMFLSLKL